MTMVAKTNVALYAGKHADKVTILENGKLRFTLTGMDFPENTSTEVLEAYAKGQTMRRAINQEKNKSYNFEANEPYVVPHRVRDKNHFLFCKLTKSTVARISYKVDQHVGGKRYQKLLKAQKKLEAERARLAGIRKAKADMRRLARGEQAGADSAKEAKGEKGEEEDADEEGDVLDGILSESEDDDEMGEAEGDTADGPEDAEDEGNEGYQIDTKAKGKKSTHDEVDAMKIDDGSSQKKPSKRSIRKEKERKKREAREQAKGSDDDTDMEDAPKETGKRKRKQQKPPKKVRQPHQRRKVTK